MTRCIDEAICPKCEKRFVPEPLSEEPPEYSYNCPHCGASLKIFESVEYQVDFAEEA